MNALAQWNQYREMEALHRSLGSLFSHSPVRAPDVLKVHLAKNEKARPQQVEVSVN